MNKIKSFDQDAAEEVERCMRLLLHGVYMCGAFVPSLETSSRAAFSKNTELARKGVLESERVVDERRRREAAIVDALLTVSDSDWERSSNYTISKSVERQAEDNFRALGGEKGPDRKTIERWINDNIRESQTR
jgi:hypothetical protein